MTAKRTPDTKREAGLRETINELRRDKARLIEKLKEARRNSVSEQVMDAIYSYRFAHKELMTSNYEIYRSNRHKLATAQAQLMNAIDAMPISKCTSTNPSTQTCQAG